MFLLLRVHTKQTDFLDSLQAMHLTSSLVIKYIKLIDTTRITSEVSKVMMNHDLRYL